MFSAGPRQERFNRLNLRVNGSSPLTLHVVPKGQQCVKPLMYNYVRHELSDVSECVIETDGRTCPVVDQWVREGKSGVPMTQLHLETSR